MSGEHVLKSVLFILYQLLYIDMYFGEISNQFTPHYPEWVLVFLKLFHGMAIPLMGLYFIQRKSGKRVSLYVIKDSTRDRAYEVFAVSLIIFDLAIWVHKTFFASYMPLLNIGISIVTNGLLLGPSWYFCCKLAFKKQVL